MIEALAGSGLAPRFLGLHTLPSPHCNSNDNLFPALGLLFLAALYDRRFWILYGIVTVTFAVNFEATFFRAPVLRSTRYGHQHLNSC